MNELSVGNALYEVIEVSRGKHRVIKNIITEIDGERIVAKHPEAGCVEFYSSQIGSNPYLTYAEAIDAAKKKRMSIN